MATVGLYYANVLDTAVGGCHGLKRVEFLTFEELVVIREIHEELKEVFNRRNEPKHGLASPLGVINAPYDEELREQVQKIVSDMRATFSDDFFLLHCGIGGSELGASNAISAVGNPNRIVPIVTLNPTFFACLGKQVIPARTVVDVISRSGSTLETQIAASKALDLIKARCEEQHLKKHVLVVTAERSELDKKMERELGCQRLCIYLYPEHSGRFSALCAANLLTMGLMGVDIEELHAGAREMLGRCMEADGIFDNPAMLQAAIIYRMNQKKDIVDDGKVTERVQKVILHTGAFSPYLVKHGEWFDQLVEESLGHRKDIALSTKTTELPNKLHSNYQNWIEGANIFLHRFLKVLSFEEDVEVSDNGLQGALEEYENATYLATVRSLAQQQRPNYTVFLHSVSPRAIGALMQLDMLSVIYLGEAFGLRINGEKEYFDQPGVTHYKALVKDYLKKRENIRKEMQALTASAI